MIDVPMLKMEENFLPWYDNVENELRSEGLRYANPVEKLPPPLPHLAQFTKFKMKIKI